MEFVLDCSVAMGWCFEDQATPYTDGVLETLAGDQALVPSIWTLEVANVLLSAERNDRMKQADSARFLALLQSLPIAVERDSPQHVWNEVIHLGREYKLWSYDASYLELAMRSGSALETLDRKLKKAAEKAGVELMAVSRTPKRGSE